MADFKTLQIEIETQLKDFDKTLKYISDGISKQLVDGIDEKTLDKIRKRLQTAFAQFNVGNFTDALNKMDEVASGLIRAVEAINIAAGGASSELIELTDNLKKAQKAAEALKAADPAAKYRPIKDDQGNVTSYVRSKAGLNREAVGITDWATGKASFTGKNGEAVEVDYGGKTWSVNTAISNLVKELNKGTLVLSNQVQKAFNEFGFKVSGKPGDYTATRQDLTVQRTNEINQWAANVQKAELAVADAKAKVEAAELDADKVKITAETGEFVTPLDNVVQGQKKVLDLQEQNNQLNKEAEQALHRKSDAEEDARDAAEKHTKATQQNTNAVAKAVSTFFGYQMVIRQLRRLWREAIHTITELDKQLTNQAVVTGMTRQETWQLINTYQELADATGLAQTTIAGVTTEYLRQGESLQNALVLTKAAAAAATVAGISAQDSVKYLTTAIHGFKLEAEDALAVSDKFAALAVDAATNYEDLAIALSKVASQAALAGMSMDYTLALLTTGLDVTQEAPESIGTALKTVIARMREISDYGKTLEDGIDINQVEDGLRAVNIELRNGEGELRSTEAVLDELGRKWETLTANQQAAVAKALAGTRQQSRLVAIMENYNKVLEYQETAANSIGATTAQQVTYLTGLEAATNRLQNAYQSLIEQLIHSDEVIGVVNFITKLIKQITKFLSQPMGRWALFSTIAAFMLRSEQFVTKMRQGFDSMVASLNKIANKQREITAEEQKQAALNAQAAKQKTGLSGVIGAFFGTPGRGWGTNLAASWKAWRDEVDKKKEIKKIDLDPEIKQMKGLTKFEKQRYQYAKKQLESEKYQNIEDNKQLTAEQKQTLQDEKQLLQSEKNSLEAKSNGTANKNGKIGAAANIASYLAVATTAISWATEIADVFKNAAKEAAEKQLEKATEIQSKIYTNTQTISSITKLSNSFDELDKKVVKTAEDMQSLSDVRTQLLEILALNESSAKGISTAVLRDRALAKRTELENKNLELIQDFAKELMGEAGSHFDWGAAITNVAMKAGTGALLGAGVGQGIGAGIGAGIGVITGIAEEVTRALRSNDSREKIAEMMKTDEGVQQFQTLLNYNYKAAEGLDTATETAVRSNYANLVSLLSGEQIESLLKQYDYNIETLTTRMRDSFIGVGAEAKVLNDEFAKTSEKTDAVAKIYNQLLTESPELAEAFRKSYEPYYQLAFYLGDATKVVDEFGWSIGRVGELMNALINQGIKPEEAFQSLKDALTNATDPMDALIKATEGWSDEAIAAATAMLTSGRSMQDIADQQTAAINKVKTMRETQAKWGSMSPSERRAYMDDNAEFFRIPGAREAFLEGRDITEYVAQYRQQLQAALREDLENQRYAAYLRLNELNEKAAKATGEEAEALKNEIADLTNNIADLESEIDNVDHMFDLSLSDIVSKQNDQIAKLKEMYQAEEKALTDSLNKRKEAYQKYFDSIASQEAAADYAESRDQLIESISSLSGGTDATSRNKVADLRKQLAQLEKEEAQRKTEEARQAVIQDIDDQVARIEERFGKLLENNQELLNSMDENTEAQYLQYLATLGLSGEDLMVRTQELSDLLRGVWTKDGLKSFGSATIEATQTPQSPTTQKDPQSVMNLSIAGQTEKVTLKQSDMKELIRQMFTWLNANAGTHFIVS